MGNILQFSIVVWFATFIFGPSEALADAKLLLIPNFKVEARLKVIRQNTKTGLDEDFIVKESYSNVARRARLDLLQQDEQDSSLKRNVRYYYHDNSKQQIIKTNSLEGFASAECLAADPEQLIDDLFGDLARSDKSVQAKDWLQVTDPVPSYVIGLARLLVLIKLNEEKYTLRRDENPLVRNQRTVKYMLDLPGGRKLAIYYAKLHHEPLEFPLKIWMSFAGGGEIIADFSNVDISPNMDTLIWPAESDRIDQLGFPLGIGCAKHLAPAKLLTDGLVVPKVVSFRASIKRRAQVPAGQDNPVKTTFVAYDGYVKMLRLDTMRNKQRADDEFNEHSITIYDIVRHRKYNIKQQVSSGASRNKITVDRSGGSQCASSQMFTDGILNPFEPIIPLDNISEMGTGMVRGVRTRIFEQVSLTLPPMLFPQVNYATVDGKVVSKFEPTDEEEEEEEKQQHQEYTITYYFAVPEMSVSGEKEADNDDDNDNKNSNLLKLGPLMRIDISRQEPLYRVEVEDFVWQLNEAPNGDRQDELFSLYDRCSSSTTGGADHHLDASTVENTNSYVQMSINLEYQPDGVEAKRGRHSVVEASRMLESPITRNKALIRALCDASEQIVAKQIHDIESKMIVQADKLTLKAGAKLSGQSLKLYEAKSIGTGLPEASIQTTGASDFDDCYWDAVHKRKQGQQLLFSYCFYLCLIDDKPQMDYTSNNNKQGSIAGSQVFNPLELNNGNAYPCQVFKLEQQPDEIADRIATRSIYNKLRSTTIRFPLLDLFGGSKKVDSLKFKVSQIDLGNEKWTASLRNSKGQLEPNRDYLLKGLALSPSDARLVKAPAFKGDKKQQQQQQQQQEQVADLAQMSLDMCHSSCMANISCNSFSVCANGQQVECLVSDLQFTDASAFDQINEKLAKLSYRQRTRLGSVLIDLPIVQTSGVNDYEQQQSVRPIKRTVELQVNNKCRIYNKYAIEMFRLVEKVSIKTPERFIIAADDEEQCAQSCLRANAKFFKRMAEIKLRWLSQSNNGDNNNNDDDDDYMNGLLEKHEINMRYWCGSFKYLNLATAVEPYSLREVFASSPDKLSKNGLCLLSRVAGMFGKWANDNKTSSGLEDKQVAATSKGSNPKPRMPRMMFHSYEFVYTMLYEKHFGIQLGTEIYLRGSKFDQFANKQLVSALPDAEHCARACFLQTSQLKPFCRSFAFVTEIDQALTYCIFNSMSLWEVRQQVREIEGATGERVEAPVSGPMREGVEVWHFEPRSAYSLDELILAQLIGSSGDDDGDNDESGGSRAIVISCLGILVVVALSLISGLLMGATLANRIVNQNGRRESIENPSRSFLNSLIGSESSISHRRFVEPDVDLPELDRDVGFQKFDN